MQNVVWIGVALAVVIVAGCAGPVPPHATAMIQRGAAAYERGDDATAIKEMDRFIAMYGDSQEAAEAHYVRGLARGRAASLAAGEPDFRRAIELTRRDDLAGRSQLVLAKILEMRGQDKAAEAAFLAALARLPQREPPADEVLFGLGCLLQRQGRWEEADTRFDRLRHLFPVSGYVPAMARRIRARAWTVQTGAFSRQSNAVRQRAELAAQGLPARVAVINPARPLHAVQVGRYATERQAASAAAGIRKHAAGAFVTTAR